MSLLLSICIPTYNRALFLDQLLKSIESNIAGFEDLVEVVISNNAGTDTTSEVVSRYRETIPHMRYYQQETCLLPGEIHFYFVASQGRGKYIWIIGDDDCINENAIKMVVERLHKGPD